MKKRFFTYVYETTRLKCPYIKVASNGRLVNDTETNG